MSLVAKIKLIPTGDQAEVLRATILLANEACNWISERAWQALEFDKYELQKLIYREARTKFPQLSSQQIILCCRKVADAYQVDQEVQRVFKPLGSIAYDARILTWVGRSVNIRTLKGRQKIEWIAGEDQARLLDFPRGETDLILRKGKFFLHVSVETPETQELPIDDFLGVDLGVVNLAVDSDGEFFSGKQVEVVRLRRSSHRQRLQSKGQPRTSGLLFCRPAHDPEHPDFDPASRALEILPSESLLSDDEMLEAARAMWREGFQDRVRAMESILCVPSTEDLPTPLGDGDE